jgi:hypothetical protein
MPGYFNSVYALCGQKLHLIVLYHIFRFGVKKNLRFCVRAGKFKKQKQAQILRQPAFIAGVARFSGEFGLLFFRFGQFLYEHFADTQLCGFGGGVLFDV